MGSTGSNEGGVGAVQGGGAVCGGRGSVERRGLQQRRRDTLRTAVHCTTKLGAFN